MTWWTSSIVKGICSHSGTENDWVVPGVYIYRIDKTGLVFKHFSSLEKKIMTYLSSL